jgi:hypothetical protein
MAIPNGSIIQIVHNNTHLTGIETDETRDLFNNTPFKEGHTAITRNLFQLDRNHGEQFQYFLERASNYFAGQIINYQRQAIALIVPVPVVPVVPETPNAKLINRLSRRITLGIIEFKTAAHITVHKQYFGCPSNPTHAIDATISYASVRPRVIRINIRYNNPKGSIEQGETLINCAIRELCEETGLGANINLVDTQNNINLGNLRLYRVFRQFINDDLRNQFDAIILAKNNSPYAELHDLVFRPDPTWYNLIVPVEQVGVALGGYYNKYLKYKTKYLQLKNN